MRGADLINADLRGARLEDADLTGADLAGAQLDGASLAGAALKAANLCGASLADVRGLTAEQIDKADGDLGTVLPYDLERPLTWTVGQGAFHREPAAEIPDEERAEPEATFESVPVYEPESASDSKPEPEREAGTAREPEPQPEPKLEPAAKRRSRNLRTPCAGSSRAPPRRIRSAKPTRFRSRSGKRRVRRSPSRPNRGMRRLPPPIRPSPRSGP
ncbi:MAG: hypothetical protein A49_28160 [Methyloceanibacter sp.]|nr:MAG: hypothetical protein A49_28160 [Methyloceanibacter sp.]